MFVLTGILLATKAYGLNFPVSSVAGPDPLFFEVSRKISIGFVDF